MAAVGFYIVKGIWFLMSLLPLKVLYFISDLLFYPIYYTVKARAFLRKITPTKLKEEARKCLGVLF